MRKSRILEKGLALNEEVVECFRSFFSGELGKELGLDALATTYNWEIRPKLAEKVDLFNTHSNYEMNVELKRKLHERWIEAQADERLSIAKDVIADWGGIRSNKQETLQGFVAMAESEDPETPIKGVASYSKLLAVSQPTKYAIYDARVAVSLNAVQMLAGQKGFAFPYLAGRNNVVGHLGKKQGFSQDPKYSISSLLRRGWTKVPKDQAYGFYLRLLNAVKPRVSNTCEIHDLEMVLFSQAETLVRLAQTSFRD